MKGNTFKVAGLAFVCFAAGIIIQIFIPNLFIVILLAIAVLLAGLLLLKL